MGAVVTAPVHGAYVQDAFFKGFTEGYNTMDALASLAFGIIVVQTLKDLGVTSPKHIALGTVKAGVVSIILMGVIYSCLAYIGATSIAAYELSANGGIALAQMIDLADEVLRVVQCNLRIAGHMAAKIGERHGPRH